MKQAQSGMRRLFSAETHQLLLMRLETALARVQARAGIIPQRAANAIAESASLEHVPLHSVETTRARVGHPMVALLQAWNDALPDGSGEWLHFGATTQDIEDTALLIEVRSAAELMLGALRRTEDRLLAIASQHAGTPMIGRTVGRHALPITFGLKVSRWAAESRRGMERIKSWLLRHEAGMLSGAVGTYASMGPDALAIERAFLAELGLKSPWAADWKGSKDMFAEFGAALSILAMTWRKIAQEIFLLQGDDFGELEECSHAVGSSTMPHKVNPRHCRVVMALSRTVVHQGEELLDWMVSIFERDQVSNASSVAAMCITFDDLLTAASEMITALRVNTEAMKRNLSRSGGIIMAEHAMFLLADAIGKHTAHRLVREASQRATREGITLADAIRATPALASAAQTLDLDTKLDPARYLGLSLQSVASAIEDIKRQQASDLSLA